MEPATRCAGVLHGRLTADQGATSRAMTHSRGAAQSNVAYGWWAAIAATFAAGLLGATATPGDLSPYNCDQPFQVDEMRNTPAKRRQS